MDDFHDDMTAVQAILSQVQQDLFAAALRGRVHPDQKVNLARRLQAAQDRVMKL